MGLILDSSVIIDAERRGDSVAQLLKKVFASAGNQEVALSSIGLTELVHGIYRAQTAQARTRRDSFLQDLLKDMEVFPYTKDTALLAGKIDGEQQSRGIVIPFADLLIGATALLSGYSILTVNARHFRLIPNLSVVQL
jgi:predicted nucleic acid-binding protein